MIKKKIAFFDFDGTITKKDTLLEFIKFCKGSLSFYTGLLLYSPYLILFKLKLISNQRAKEAVLRYFFKNMPLEVFQQKCKVFNEQVMPGLIRPKALAEINILKNRGIEVVIVSASPRNWIMDWAQKHQVDLIATHLQTKDERLSGIIEGRNCHGQEKVRRIKEKYNLAEFAEVYAYGDTKGDLPMLEVANYSFFKPFR